VAAPGVGSPAVGGVLYPLAVLAAIVLGAFGFGSSLPVAHVASRSRKLPARPEIVWGLINDPVATKGWAGDAKTDVVEQDPPRLLVRKIVGEKASHALHTPPPMTYISRFRPFTIAESAIPKARPTRRKILFACSSPWIARL